MSIGSVGFSVGTFLLVIQQLIIGISLGFLSNMVLNTFVLAGQIVALQTGLGFASIVDPVNGISVPAVGQFYLILATLLFWSLDGHLSMIRVVVMSFEAFPIGEAWFAPEQFRDIAHWAGWMFISAVTISLAPIVSLLIVNLAFGVMTKAAPQLNIFSIGFAIAQIMGLLIIWLTLFKTHMSRLLLRDIPFSHGDYCLDSPLKIAQWFNGSSYGRFHYHCDDCLGSPQLYKEI